MAESMTLNFKSKTGICPCAKPREAFIVKIGKNGNEVGRKQVGEPIPPDCQHCGKPWSEH